MIAHFGNMHVNLIAQPQICQAKSTVRNCWWSDAQTVEAETTKKKISNATVRKMFSNLVADGYGRNFLVALRNIYVILR